MRLIYLYLHSTICTKSCHADDFIDSFLQIHYRKKKNKNERFSPPDRNHGKFPLELFTNTFLFLTSTEFFLSSLAISWETIISHLLWACVWGRKTVKNNSVVHRRPFSFSLPTYRVSKTANIITLVLQGAITKPKSVITFILVEK